MVHQPPNATNHVIQRKPKQIYDLSIVIWNHQQTSDLSASAGVLYAVCYKGHLLQSMGL
jgi:hypothetical protein